MKIIFLCTANSCRSQMAETWARHLLPEPWEIHSAGLITYPITRDTRNAMREVGLDMIGQESKSLDGYDLDAFDLVVTLSDEAGRFLPQLSDPGRHLHHPLTDPMSATGTAEEIRQAFARARDQIKNLVQQIGAGELPARESRR
jgi:arsenate reductase